MSRPSYVATTSGFCMAGSSHPAQLVDSTPVDSALLDSAPIDSANAETQEAGEALQANAEETREAEQGAAESH